MSVFVECVAQFCKFFDDIAGMYRNVLPAWLRISKNSKNSKNQKFYRVLICLILLSDSCVWWCHFLLPGANGKEALEVWKPCERGTSGTSETSGMK